MNGARPDSDRIRGLTGLEVVALLVALTALFTILIGAYVELGTRPARRVRCLSNLRQIGQALHVYVTRFGAGQSYPVPAHSFRGDCWLATLHWSDILRDTGVFHCPDGPDPPPIPLRPPDLSLADSVPADSVHYAGRCMGLRGGLAHRNTASLSQDALPPTSILACDDNEGRPHHTGIVLYRQRLNAVFADGHADSLRGDDVYGQVGRIGANPPELEPLDSGE